MYRNRSVAVVVPCHNEETQIARVMETMPDYVDRVYIVDDRSPDGTAAVVTEKIRALPPGRFELIRHAVNQGVGAAIVTGYRRALEEKIDLIAVMAGDGQMDPADLPSLMDAVIDRGADYAKANRLVSGEAWRLIPRKRFLGNAALSLMTKFASGYWHIADSQTGYTVITREALEAIPYEDLYPRYGYPNHLLIMLSVFRFRVIDVPMKPVYNVGERSGIRIGKVIFTISWLLVRQFFWRLKEKYIIRDCHPLLFGYLFGVVFLLGAGLMGARMFLIWALYEPISTMNFVLFLFAAITGLQFLFFSIWLDMEDCRRPRN
jgi:glycosyltransferase involved in cell wall biosynthesis